MGQIEFERKENGQQFLFVHNKIAIANLDLKIRMHSEGSSSNSK